MDKYSRQIGAYGIEAMSKLIQLKVRDPKRPWDWGGEILIPGARVNRILAFEGLRCSVQSNTLHTADCRLSIMRRNVISGLHWIL